MSAKGVRGALLVGAFFAGVIVPACHARRGSGTARPMTSSPPPRALVPHAIAPLHNDSPFGPAFARLDAHTPLDVSVLGDAVQCGGCHADVVAQWDTSAHHGSSFTNRFYAASVDLTRKERGLPASRWCAGCHDPSLLFGGAIDAPIAKDDPRAGDGVACLVCHSTSKPSRLGNGGYTLAWSGFHEPDAKDAASITAHRAAMRPSAMVEGEFCASCHKVSIHEQVNGKRWLRGQNDFDGWEQGPYALGGARTAGAIYAPDVEARTCQQCHMAREPATAGDLAAHADASGQKTVRSHRFLAANTALAAFAHDAGTVAAQAAMLKDAVRVDVVAVRTATDPGRAILLEDAANVGAGTLMLDVVVENTRVGHRFPTGTADSNQIWLAVEVRDARGRLLGASGEVDPKTAVLDPDAHTFGVLQLDAQGKPATQRDPHRFVAAGWDTTIAPRDAAVIRYALRAPTDVALPLYVRAIVRYRKFTPAFTRFACTSTAASLPPLADCPALPIVDVAEHDAIFGAPATDETAKLEPWKRLDVYARGLLQALQEEVGAARPILDRAIELGPTHADGRIDLARLFIREGRTADAIAALDAAAAIDPRTPVVPYLRAIAAYEVYKLADAVDPLRLAIGGAPKSVHAFELLAEGLELRGEDLEAIGVAQQGLVIDPENAQLHHLEALGFDALALPTDAEIARGEYLRYRKDDDTAALRAACKREVPGCAREANPLHVHTLR